MRKTLRALRDIWRAYRAARCPVVVSDDHYRFMWTIDGVPAYTDDETVWRQSYYQARTGQWYAWVDVAPGMHDVPRYHLRRVK